MKPEELEQLVDNLEKELAEMMTTKAQMHNRIVELETENTRLRLLIQSHVSLANAELAILRDL